MSVNKLIHLFFFFLLTNQFKYYEIILSFPNGLKEV